ncbi:hypothetical protein ABMA28_013399 [Loxostege sticticalis]|uniref:RNA-directed DNA polymerase n=1 Tax=Loxostege sticticalis TaxID=481309 RepID=A0ABD0TI86_LOXSC
MNTPVTATGLGDLANIATQVLKTELTSSVESNYDLIDKILPTYDGNTKSLNFYVRSDNDPIAICLIRNKLIGKALEAISLEIDIEDWKSIKLALINRFGEQRTEVQILQEMMRCNKQRHESCEMFGRKIRDLLDALCGVGTTPKKDSRYYQTVAIDTYVDNLDYNVGLGVRLSQPKTLETAIALARQEEARLKRVEAKTNTVNPQNQTKSINSRPFVRQNNSNNWPRSVKTEPNPSTSKTQYPNKLNNIESLDNFEYIENEETLLEPEVPNNENFPESPDQNEATYMGGNFLIDTGASRSLISPESIGNFEFGQQITNEPYSISTAHGTSHHNQVAHIPLPPLFGTEPIVHKFLVFDFDSNYKGLIGNDLLRVLGARIDYNKKKLFTRTTAIPLLFDNIIIKRRLSQEAQLNNINTCRDDNELKNNLNRIRTDHLNSEEKREINKLCYQYRDIFYSEKMPLTFTHSVKHKLRLTDETPIFTKNYRKPPCEQVEIQKQVDDLVKKGIVRESMSPWSSPVHIVPKKADASGKVKWRLVIDYRKLNDRTIEDKFPIPNITDILDKLGRAQYFSTIDLASGYHQVEMDERDIEKTAFTTDRHYEFLRMPFGLKNAPSTFQRLMNNILRDLLYDTCIVYLDDILIYSVSLQDHIKKLKRVFDRLREHNFKVQLDKSEFLRKEVIYLGHTLTQEGLKPNEDKIKAIKKFPIPATQKEIKSFLGLVGYYRKFIPDFAKMTKPMTKCLKKNAKVTHTPEFIDSFNKSKDILCNAPVLQYPDFEKPFILTTDASDVSIGAVLSQGTVGTDRPIAYASRTLSQTEIKYSTIEKELLAIVWAVKYFRPYLYGRKFTIYSDHKPLTWLMSLKDPNSKLTRWRLRLEEYDYQIVYKKGKYNTNADALSRIKINALDIEPQPSTSSAQHDLFQEIESITDIPIIESTQSQVVRDDSNDIDVCDVDIRTLLDIPVTPSDTQSQRNENMDGIADNDDVITDDSNKIIPTCPDAIDKQLKQFHIRSSPGNEYRIEDHSKKNFVIKNVFIPINNTEEQVIKFLREHTIADRKFFCYYHNEELFPIFCKVLNSVFDNNRGPKLVRCLTRVTLVDNANEIEQLIKRYHEGKTIHRGIQETYKKLRKNYHWTNMLITIQKYINDCETCRKSKYERNPIKPPLALTETPEKPMDHMFMDLFSIDGCTFLTIIDNFTKFAQAVMLPAATGIHVAEALLSLLSIIGIPNKITTDSDHKFDNEIIKEICAMHKINIHFTTPYNPNSNSPIERFHSTLGELIRIQKLTDKSDINSLIRNAIIAYNNTIHNATGFTPFELLYGHTSSRNPLELFYTTEFYQDYVQKHKAQMENAQKLVSLKLSIDKEQTITKANKTSEIIPFKIGDKVYKQVAKTARSKKTEPRYLGPYTIIRIHPNNIYEIIGKHVNSKSIRVHCRLLRRPSVTIAESPSPASLRENIHLLENVIGIKAYSTLTSITFILEVPLISPASYDLLHLYSIPNNKNLTRIPKAPLLILGSKEYAYPHEPCQRLDDELSICNHLQLESIQNEDCIVQVIRHAASNNCRYAEVILPPVKIQQVHQNTWLVISRNPEILKVKCGNDEKYQRIQNTYLLTTTEACKLEINGQVLQTHHKTLNIKETIPLPRIHLPESNVTWKNVHLENINLDKLHAIATSISMQPEISNDYGIATKPSWTSIILIAILAAVAAYYARRKFGTIKCTRTKRNARNTPEDIELNVVPRTESTSLAQPLQLQAHTLAEHHRLREPTPTVRSPLGREELCRLSP